VNLKINNTFSYLVVVLFLVVYQSSFAQKNTAILVEINNENITVEEFKKVYEKNLTAIDNEESKDVTHNLELFINYKLKIKEAFEMMLDTVASYKRELETYQNQLTAPYLQDNKYLEELKEKAYFRMKNEIRASHILIRVPKNATPKDTAEAYVKIKNIKARIDNGESFDQLARKLSEDPSAKINGGDLGYFSAFRMVFPFEDAAYGTELGKVSEPFKTRFGYHIVKPVAMRKAEGEIEVAHILIMDASAKGKTKIDTVYSKLQKGESFASLAKIYSNDNSTKNIGGKLRKFGRGRMVKEFENAAFALQTSHDFSKPFKTRFGWHIVQLIKRHPIRSFKEEATNITDKIRRSGRANLSKQVVIDRLKKKYNIVENQTAKEIFKRDDIRAIPSDSLQATLFTINSKKVRQEEFVNFINQRRFENVNDLYVKFKDGEVLDYYKENLKNTNPEFSATIKEYQEGLLLFELMNTKIWEKSQDSISLSNYFIANKQNYNNDLQTIKGKVMTDYQNQLEKNWVKDLRSNNTVKINKRILRKVINFYRKEDK